MFKVDLIQLGKVKASKALKIKCRVTNFVAC